MTEISHTHISSAVIGVLDAHRSDIVRRIQALPGAEVMHAEGNKLIVVMETAGSKEAGAHLAAISTFKGVISASLVYEHAEATESLGEIV